MKRASNRSLLSRCGWLAVAVASVFATSARADSSTTTLPDASAIKALFPKVNFDLGEDCRAPAVKGGSSGIALYHAGVHPKNSARVMVTYALMFVRDCGMDGHEHAHGADPHPGDIEYFHYTLKQDSTCSTGWRIHALKTVAHSGDPSRREINERILDSCNAPEIYSSLGKHALYTSWGDCAKRMPAEICLQGDASGFTLYDVGTSSADQPDLSSVFGSTDSKLWNGDGYFCGGLSVERSKCVNSPAEKLVYPEKKLAKWEFPDPDLGGSHKCPYGMQESAGLCYKECDDGFSGGAATCLATCPNGYKDEGLYCGKGSYGRGAGYPWKFGDGTNDKGMFKRCEKAHGDGNCEKSGDIVYPKCKTGYKAVGCCVCSQECPAHTKDIGASCQKDSYTRGIGVVP